MRSEKYEGSPPQGLSEARRGREFVRDFKLFVTDPPRGRPAGGGGVHHNKLIKKLLIFYSVFIPRLPDISGLKNPNPSFIRAVHKIEDLSFRPYNYL
jgi:hypothetical protein